MRSHYLLASNDSSETIFVKFEFYFLHKFYFLHEKWRYVKTAGLKSNKAIISGKICMFAVDVFSSFGYIFPVLVVVSVSVLFSQFSQLLWNFIEITLWHGCSPVNLLHIFRKPFLKDTSEWLLLFLCKWIKKMFFLKRNISMYMLSIVVINKQKYCLERKKWSASVKRILLYLLSYIWEKKNQRYV